MEFDRVYAVNVKSIYHMAQAVVPVLANEGGGVIINIGSTAAIRPRPGLTWYNGSKGAVNLMSRSMAVELTTKNPRELRGSRYGRDRSSWSSSWACPTRPRTARSSSQPCH